MCVFSGEDRSGHERDFWGAGKELEMKSGGKGEINT